MRCGRGYDSIQSSLYQVKRLEKFSFNGKVMPNMRISPFPMAHRTAIKLLLFVIALEPLGHLDLHDTSQQTVH
jgi:hypothetical protein